jgi:hypothetical protein
MRAQIASPISISARVFAGRAVLARGLRSLHNPHYEETRTRRHRIEAEGKSAYRPGGSRDWIKFENPDAPAVMREAEQDWGRA